MKRFLLKAALLVLLVFSSFYYIATQADGYTDTYYVKFTTPEQQALILGNSKALHGMVPDVLDSVFKEVYPGRHLFNFAFSLGHSPYGPVYFKAICEKLDNQTKNGIFILTVDPWSISGPQGSPNDSSRFFENNLFLAKTRVFNANPNLDYLLRSYEGAWGNIILNKFKKSRGVGFLHDNGWLEVNVEWDSTSAHENMAIKEEIYRNEYLPSSEFSLLRLSYLDKTIKMLKEHGDVYLVRLPVHKRLMEVDMKLMPDFNLKMEQLCGSNNIRYFNFIDSSQNFLFNDGVHLHKSSGRKLSFILANMILKDKSRDKKQNNFISRTRSM